MLPNLVQSNEGRVPYCLEGVIQDMRRHCQCFRLVGFDKSGRKWMREGRRKWRARERELTEARFGS